MYKRQECTERDSYKNCFYELILKANEKYQEKVVVLVDEYDKPILDRIEEPEIARENREILKDFYSVLKDTDIYLKLVSVSYTHLRAHETPEHLV